MIDRKEIEKQLKEVDPALAAAFAIRAAVRLLPVFSSVKHPTAFGYWQENKRSVYILAIMHALQIAFYALLNNKKGNLNTLSKLVSEDVGADKASDAATYTAYYVARAARAVADAFRASKAVIDEVIAIMPVSQVNGATTDDYSSVYLRNGAAHYGASAYDAKAIIGKACEHDLALITKLPRLPSINRTDILNFLAEPLWPDRIPEVLKSSWERFKKEVLSLESGFDIWLEWYQDYFEKQKINEPVLEKLATIPSEIIEQGPKAVNAYLRQNINKQSSIALNLVRAIFIGNGEAGKTSLIRKLHGEGVVPGEEKMTPGIKIREWPVGDTDIKARFWDFGGQVISHSTHQFFLRERCLYIIVLASRNEFNAHIEAQYWLEHVKAFGKNAPVMLVGNKSELMQINMDLGSLKEKYPNIIDFYQISCVDKSSKFNLLFSIFQEDLIEHLQKVGTHQLQFTEQQYKVIEEIRLLSQQDSFLKHDKFNQLCQEFKIDEENGLSKEDFLGILDKVGEVIHFPQINYLTSYVLNPRWLTYGVYTLLYSNEIEQHPCGELTEQQVINILQQKQVKDDKGNLLTYPKDKCIFIIDAMQEFEICYKFQNDSKRFVIPDKLLAKKPDFKFDKLHAGTISFEFDFKGLLPRNIMPNLIVRRHPEIKDNIVWQNGVLLYNQTHNTMSLIEVDYHLRTLNLWIQGSGAREILAILDDEILKIIKKMDLYIKEILLLPESALLEKVSIINQEEKAPYRQLLETAKSGIPIFVTESGNKYDINKVLGSIMTDSAIRDIHINNFNGQFNQTGKKIMGNSYRNIGNNNTDSVVTNNLNSNFSNAKQIIGNSPNTNDKEKQQLQDLVAELEQALNQLPKENAEQAETVAVMVEQVATNASQENPNKSLLDITGKGLIEATKALASISPTVFDLANKVVTFINNISAK